MQFSIALSSVLDWEVAKGICIICYCTKCCHSACCRQGIRNIQGKKLFNNEYIKCLSWILYLHVQYVCDHFLQLPDGHSNNIAHPVTPTKMGPPAPKPAHSAHPSLNAGGAHQARLTQQKAGMVKKNLEVHKKAQVLLQKQFEQQKVQEGGRRGVMSYIMT